MRLVVRYSFISLLCVIDNWDWVFLLKWILFFCILQIKGSKFCESLCYWGCFFDWIMWDEVVYSWPIHFITILDFGFWDKNPFRL